MDPFARLLLGWTVWRHHDGDPAPSAPAPTAPPPPPPSAPEPPAAPAPAPQPASASAQPPAPSGTAPAPAAPVTPATFDQWIQDPVNAGFVKTLRDEAAGHRTGKKAAEDRAQGILAAVMQAAGLQPDGKPDPEKVIAELRTQHDQTAAELRQLRIDGALSAAASKHQADPRLARALLLSDGALNGLDPAAADFADQLDAALAKVVAEVPAVKLAPAAPAPPPAPAAPPVSGGQFNGPGAQNGVAQLTRDDLKGMTPEQIVAAQKEGRLDALLRRI